MKKLVVCILFFLSLACSDNEEKLYFEYLKGYNESIKIIDHQKKLIYDDFEFEIRGKLSGNLERIKPWYEKAISLKQYSNKIIRKIDNLSISLVNYSAEELFKQKHQIKKTDLVNLEFEFKNFQKYIFETIKDTARYNILAESIKSHLKTDNWNQTPCLIGDETKLIETIAVLSKLKADIKMAESDLLRFLHIYIGSSSFRFNKLGPIVEPIAQIIPQGYSYTANIIFAALDSTVNPMIFVEGEELDVNSGVGVYKEKVSTEDTLVQRFGYFKLINPRTAKFLKLHFKLEYEVIK